MTSSTTIRVRLGTRASDLARWQADWVAARLGELGADVQLVPIATAGDQQQVGPIGAIGGQGVFTKEIQRALLDDRIDLAVHSLKDLPTDEVPGLCLAAVPERAPVGDALVCREYDSFDSLPEDAVVGSGSLRRVSQLLHARPKLRMQDIRGNVETRLAKLDRGEFDAIILAVAGLQRLGLAERITQVLPISTILPAVGQGALGLETRSDDTAVRAVLDHLCHGPSHAAVLAERAMLAALQGGCLAPIAAWGRDEDGQLALTGRVVSPDGERMLEDAGSADWPEAESLGRQVADRLLEMGAAEIIQASRGSV